MSITKEGQPQTQLDEVDEITRQIQSLAIDQFNGFFENPKKRDELVARRREVLRQRGERVSI